MAHSPLPTLSFPPVAASATMGSIADRLKALPVSNPSVSYWQAESQDSSLHDHGKDDALPSISDSVDVVIIGSGMSGAVAAYELQRRAPHLSLVMLEARQACSGATGRNGGHCRPDSFLGFHRYSSIVGKEQAHQVLLNEWNTFSYIREVVKREEIHDCDWWEGLTMSVYLNEVSMEQAQKSYSAYKEYTSLRPGVEFIEDAERAQKMSRLTTAKGAAVFPAGSFYPLRFVHSLLSICLAKGNFRLFTHTLVQSMHKDTVTNKWTMQTPKGSLCASKVLLATNGYSRALLPSLDDFLLSHRAHCSSIVPPANYRDENRLKSTCSIVRQAEDYEYLVQRPNDSESTFILGGGNTQVNRHEEADTYDDSYVNSSLGNYFAAYPEESFEGWESGAGKLSHLWTGIQGYTRDSLPIVGESFESEQKGLYFCLGHHGHGMARAATCARGVANLLSLDKSKLLDDYQWNYVTNLPLCYRWTKKRAERRDVDHRFDF